MKRPFILYYSDCPFFGGCENMIANFLNDEKLGHEYDVSFLYRYSKAYQEALIQRVPHSGKKIDFVNLPDAGSAHQFFKKRIGNKFFRILVSSPLILIWKYYCILFSVFPLYRKLKGRRIDILHINNGGYPAAVSSYSIIIVAKWLEIKKIVYVVNNIAQGYENPLRWIDYPFDRLVKGVVSKFITGSEFAKNALIHCLSLSNGQAISIPNGILPRTITIGDVAFRQALNIPDQKIIFSVIALLEKRKGHMSLLKAINRLKSEHETKPLNFPFFIFEGSGSEEKNIRDFIVENKLEADVLLLGNIDNVFNLINASNVIILPSLSHEDFPNIVLESMLLGKPVIGTRISGIPEQIIDGVSGLIVMPDNVEQLANAIKKLLDEKLRKNLSSNSMQRFQEKYSARISINQYIEVYKRIL